MQTKEDTLLTIFAHPTCLTDISRDLRQEARACQAEHRERIARQNIALTRILTLIRRSNGEWASLAQITSNLLQKQPNSEAMNQENVCKLLKRIIAHSIQEICVRNKTNKAQFLASVELTIDSIALEIHALIATSTTPPSASTPPQNVQQVPSPAPEFATN